MVGDHPVDPADHTGDGTEAYAVEHLDRGYPRSGGDAVCRPGDGPGHVCAVSIAVVPAPAEGGEALAIHPARELPVVEPDAGIDDVGLDSGPVVGGRDPVVQRE